MATMTTEPQTLEDQLQCLVQIHGLKAVQDALHNIYSLSSASMRQPKHSENDRDSGNNKLSVAQPPLPQLDEMKTAAENLNQSILDASFEAVVVADENSGVIVKVNAAMLSIFGFESYDDVLGQNLSTLVGGNEGHAENHSSYMQAFRERAGTSAILVRVYENLETTTRDHLRQPLFRWWVSQPFVGLPIVALPVSFDHGSSTQYHIAL